MHSITFTNRLLLLFGIIGMLALGVQAAPPAPTGQAPAPTVADPVQLQHPEQLHLISKTKAVVLGVVEGLTEYLPVSSTGHLLVAQHFMGIEGSNEEQRQSINAYLVIIQFGAILAILLLYFGRVRQVFAGLVGRNPGGLKLLRNLIVAFLPAAVVGLIFNDAIDRYLFGIKPVIIAWVVGGLVILYVVRKRRQTDPLAGTSVDDLTFTSALIIGCLQCVAMWPGVSRSLATILGGLLVGMSMGAAVEFSFLLGLVTLSAATIFKLKDLHGVVQNLGIISPLIGLVFAGIAAFVAVKWMVDYLNRRGLGFFGYYRLAAAAVVLVLLVMGWIR